MKKLIEKYTKECIQAGCWSKDAWDKAEENENDQNIMQSYIDEAILFQSKHHTLLRILDDLEKLQNKGQ